MSSPSLQLPIRSSLCHPLAGMAESAYTLLLSDLIWFFKLNM
jgi:hypothetical protein